MRKIVRADFFRIGLPAGTPPFQDILTNLAAEADPAQRSIETRDGWHRLQYLELRDRQWWGSCIRLRMQDLPHLGRLDGDLSALGLAEDEGLAEETSFVYQPRYGVMALQRNFQGVRPGAVEDLLARLAEIDLTLEVVLRTDTLQRLRRMRIVRDIEVTFARPSNPGVYRGLASIESMLAAADDVGAIRLKVSMGMGHRRGSLRASQAIALVRSFLRVRNDYGEEIRRLKIKGGPLEDEPMEVIDLLKHQLVEQFPVEAPGRQLPGDAVRRALAAAIATHEAELREQFGQGRRGR